MNKFGNRYFMRPEMISRNN